LLRAYFRIYWKASSGPKSWNNQTTRGCAVRSRSGFTLLEVLLAIGLTAVVLGLLTTAMQLYLFRVDTSRVHVESAQLARSLLHQIAEDIRATRFSQTMLGEDASDGEDDSEGTEVETLTEGQSTGLVGTATELRLDRAADWNWRRAIRQVDADENSAAADVPFSVRYFVRDGQIFSAEKLAAEGVGEDLPENIAGLCRERSTTSQETVDPEQVELLAPEVFEIKFAYLDGTELVDAWDSDEQGTLPRAVEIRIQMIEKPFEVFHQEPKSSLDANRVNKKDLVEYRLLVHLPKVQPPQSTAMSDSFGTSADGNGNGTKPN